MNGPSEAQPVLLVITGRPGSGKTTLAHALAKSIRCPALCRDEFKEGYVNTHGEAAMQTDESNRHIYHAFFEFVELVLRRGISVVVEAAFQHKLWAPKLEPLRQIARTRLVVCAIDGSLARDRHIARGLADPQRERYHHDHAVRAAREGLELPVGEYDPPHFDDLPMLSVNTTDGYEPSFESIISFALGT